MAKLSIDKKVKLWYTQGVVKMVTKGNDDV
jgi:hypothetical protein